MFGIFNNKTGYINHLQSITAFDTLRDDSGVFLLFFYKTKCNYCLPKFIEIYQWLERSRSTALYQIDIDHYPELKKYIAGKTNTKIKPPLVLMIKDQQVVDSRSGTKISDSNIQTAYEELVLS